MKSNTSAALAFVFKDEGGYAERPEEGGGAVNKGVTFAVYSAWRMTQGFPAPTWADLKAMTVEEATGIYQEQYLKGIHFDDLPAGVDYAVLDASITGGVAGSIKILQGVLGLEQDGHYGLVTRWAANHRPVAVLIDLLCDARIKKYQGFKIFPKVANPTAAPDKQRTWGQIWTSRIELVRTRSKGMLQTVVTEAPKPTPIAAPAIIKGSAFPPAIAKMPASTELSKGMIKRGGTPEQFLAYLRDEVHMGTWRPRGAVLHNTGKMGWPGKVTHSDGRVEILKPEQRLDNMTVDWQKRHFPSTVHLVLPPDGLVWLCWPLWKPGTGSPSWNQTFWQVETVGDFDSDKPTPELMRTLPIVLGGMYALLGQEPNNDTFHRHAEDPKTDHKRCPGKNLGTKAQLLQSVIDAMHAMNPAS